MPLKDFTSVINNLSRIKDRCRIYSDISDESFVNCHFTLHLWRNENNGLEEAKNIRFIKILM